MQHSQFNFVWHGTNCLAFTMLLALMSPAFAAKPDPILDPGPTVPCAAGVDYSGGGDVNGNEVAPADMESRRVPVPGTVMVPLHGNSNGRDSAYVALDGKMLDGLVNPKRCH
jgi:hypothetical protein